MTKCKSLKKPKRVILVAGARPNFMKVAPILEEMKKSADHFQPFFVHTGQHYDDEMSKAILQELRLPEPDVYLGVGSASHAVQTARIMMAFEEVVTEEKPGLVIVVGDVNSTLACALVASKAGVPIAHVEAGLRSFDRTMPEEINRVLTDRISDFLFTTCEDANRNLRREGIPEEHIYFVGNVMIESLRRFEPMLESSSVFDALGLRRGEYVLATLHRPSNVDDRETLEAILNAFQRIQQEIPLVFPAHPRTQKRMKEFGFQNLNSRLRVTEPMGYIEFLALEKHARFVLTDSGGIQEETTVFGIPCLTIRENTERPITIREGTNVLVGTRESRIVQESLKILNGGGTRGKVPQFWDDKVSERIVGVLRKKVGNQSKFQICNLKIPAQGG